jgi:hypothetical protein
MYKVLKLNLNIRRFFVKIGHSEPSSKRINIYNSAGTSKSLRKL